MYYNVRKLAMTKRSSRTYRYERVGDGEIPTE